MERVQSTIQAQSKGLVTSKNALATADELSYPKADEWSTGSTRTHRHPLNRSLVSPIEGNGATLGGFFFLVPAMMYGTLQCNGVNLVHSFLPYMMHVSGPLMREIGASKLTAYMVRLQQRGANQDVCAKGISNGSNLRFGGDCKGLACAGLPIGRFVGCKGKSFSPTRILRPSSNVASVLVRA